jgi:hypothetical protein
MDFHYAIGVMPMLDDNLQKNPPLLHAFSDSPRSPTALSQSLDAYGFKDSAQQKAIKFLLETAGISELVQLSSKPTTDDPELLSQYLQTFLECIDKHFIIRTGPQERWEVQPTEWMKDTQKQQAILDALTTLKLRDAIHPHFEQRDAICILGGRKRNIDLRLSFAEEALPAKLLILLAGERDVTVNQNGVSIDGTKEELETLARGCKKELSELTEIDLMRASYNEQSSLREKLPMTLIATPKGNLTRPGTKETSIELIQWLKKNPAIQTITFVSNQPHVAYQEAVIAQIFEEQAPSIKYEFIGPAFDFESTPDPVKVIQESVGALGSQIKAKTPRILESLRLTSSPHNTNTMHAASLSP